MHICHKTAHDTTQQFETNRFLTELELDPAKKFYDAKPYEKITPFKPYFPDGLRLPGHQDSGSYPKTEGRQ